MKKMFNFAIPYKKLIIYLIYTEWLILNYLSH
ncbi:hypothetical protein SAMN06298210_10125 [Prevotellaceae bacterium KH2P17]|nr:hypothetical protein SAMN06298210_10125 [Prevotellaceae bacterium KH2P17]